MRATALSFLANFNHGAWLLFKIRPRGFDIIRLHRSGNALCCIVSKTEHIDLGCPKVAKKSVFSFNSLQFGALIFPLENINHQLSPH
jgi:hypothetical protein